MKKHFSILSTIFLAVFFRVYLIDKLSFPFPQDMGRDLLWARDISFYHIPTLIGPAASIWGVYFGPLWFYILSVPLLIFGGNPVSAVYTSGLLIIASGVFSWLFFKELLGKIAIFLLLFMLFNFTSVNLSLYAFHANLLPILSVFSIYFCYLAVVKKPSFIVGSFFVTSLMFHADPAPAVVFTAIPIVVFIYFKLFRQKGFLVVCLLSAVAYAIPFIPSLLFELRNNFVQTKALLAYFQGENPSLSGQLPIMLRVPNRLSIFFDYFSSTFASGNKYLSVVVITLTIIGLYKFVKISDFKLKTLFKINVLAFLFVFLFFTFFINVEVKNWYLHGLVPIFSILLVLSFYAIGKSKITLLLITSVLLSASLFPFAKNSYLQNSLNDPATFNNQQHAVELFYSQSDVANFAVYIFTPPIYDLNWQYIFWWQGVFKNKGFPSEVAYLPQKPPYVRNKNLYAKDQKITKDIYLIIENSVENQFYSKDDWIMNFSGFEIEWEKDLNTALKIQKRRGVEN